MQYLHSKDKAEEISQKAIERIDAEGLSRLPQNYELWYVYYSAINVDVVRAIDIMIANKQKVNDDRCEELYQRFLSRNRDNDRVREAGQQISDTIKDMSGRVTGAKSFAENYGHVLEAASKALTSGDSSKPEDVKKTLDSVLDNTYDMIQHNMELEKELERSSAMMQELQRDLEKVRKQALTDGLTNLANRKAFDDELARVLAISNEQSSTFTLIFMDIDYFKSFNDNYGHQVGDQVLRLVAKTLTDGVKGRDIAARYGGEEFAIILPDTNVKGGVNVADSLRKIIQGKELVNRNTGDVLGRITLSGGVAEYIRGESVEEIIERADAALYTAKHNGRNQVVAAPAAVKTS
ncbi:MAG: GGDEF domain-containing protein [Micavibrio sp.]|nr:GGDEF domain-containing protein [Micavibrio sp.]